MYNSEGKLDYEQLGHITDRIESGEFEIARLNSKEEQGRIAGGRRNVETSLIIGANASPNQAERRDSGETRKERNQRLESALEDYANHEGIWLDYGKLLKDLAYLSKGEEAEVFRSSQKGFVDADRRLAPCATTNLNVPDEVTIPSMQGV